MRIAIIGGTGSLGAGLALRLSKRHEVLVGSRDAQRATKAARRLSDLAGRTIAGGLATDVATACEVAILATSFDSGGALLSSLEAPLSRKLVISPIVPMKVQAGLFVYTPAGVSAAEQAASILKESLVAAALHTVPAPVLQRADVPLDLDVLVAADSRQTFEDAASVISSMERFRPLYAGPLTQARELERLVPLLLNVAKLNGLRNLSIKLI